MGASLETAVEALDSICHETGLLDGIGMNRGELSRLERGQRWLKPEQLSVMARYFNVSPGKLCEWLLRDRGLLEADEP